MALRRVLCAVLTGVTLAINVGSSKVPTTPSPPKRSRSRFLPAVPLPGRRVLGGDVHVFIPYMREITLVGLYAGNRAKREIMVEGILDSGSDKTIIREDVFKRMKRIRAADASCELYEPDDFDIVGGFSGTIECPSSVLLRLQFFENDDGDGVPSAAVSVWAVIIPVEGMEEKLILGRDAFSNFPSTTFRRHCPSLPGPVGEGTLTLTAGKNMSPHRSLYQDSLAFHDPRAGGPFDGHKVKDVPLPVIEHGQDFVEGAVHMDDKLFETKVGLRSPSAKADRSFIVIGALDNGAGNTCIAEDVWERMKEEGFASAVDESESGSATITGFGPSEGVQCTGKKARLCVQFCDEHSRPTAHAVVNAYILPPEGRATGGDLLLGYNILGRFNERLYEVHRGVDESERGRTGTLTFKRVGLTYKQHDLRLIVSFLLELLRRARTDTQHVTATVDEKGKYRARDSCREQDEHTLYRVEPLDRTNAYVRRLAQLSKVGVSSVERGVQSRYGLFGSLKSQARAYQIAIILKGEGKAGAASSENLETPVKTFSVSDHMQYGNWV